MGDTVRSTTSGSCKGPTAVDACAAGTPGVAPVDDVGGLGATASPTISGLAEAAAPVADVCSVGACVVAASCLAGVPVDAVLYATGVYVGLCIDIGSCVVGGCISAAPRAAIVRGCRGMTTLCATTVRDNGASGIAGVRDVDASGTAGTLRVVAELVDAPGIAHPENGSGAAEVCTMDPDGRVVAAVLLDVGTEPG